MWQAQSCDDSLSYVGAGLSVHGVNREPGHEPVRGSRSSAKPLAPSSTVNAKPPKFVRFASAPFDARRTGSLDDPATAHSLAAIEAALQKCGGSASVEAIARIRARAASRSWLLRRRCPSALPCCRWRARPARFASLFAAQRRVGPFTPARRAVQRRAGPGWWCIRPSCALRPRRRRRGGPVWCYAT